MSRKLHDALDDAYNEQQPLEARADTPDVLRKAFAEKHEHGQKHEVHEKREQRPFVLIRMLRYRMPAYQTLALTSVLLAVIAWMYTSNSDSSERIVYRTEPSREGTSLSPTTNQASVDTDAIVRRVVDSVRSEMQRESEKTRRSLEGVTKISMERMATNLKLTSGNANNAKLLQSPLPNDDAVGLKNLTQLHYQQRGKSLADDGVASRFNYTAMSEVLR